MKEAFEYFAIFVVFLSGMLLLIGMLIDQIKQSRKSRNDKPPDA